MPRQWKSSRHSPETEKDNSESGCITIHNYDPHGFLARLGLRETLTAADQTSTCFKPSARPVITLPIRAIFPHPKIAAAFQKGLFLINRVSPRLLFCMDKLLTRLVVRQLEACDTADIHKPSSYGRMEEIARGDRQTITKNERYIGVNPRKRSPNVPGERIFTLAVTTSTGKGVKISGP